MASSPSAQAMPDSERERIARLEAARETQQEQIRFLAPLVAKYAVLEERLENLRSDLNNGLEAVRVAVKEVVDKIEAIEKAQADRARERRTMMLALLIAGLGLLGTFITTLIPLLSGGGR